MKLISMTEFVLEQVQNAKYEEFNKVNETFVNKVVDYANFLNQPLTLGMFVPCDEEGDILEKPDLSDMNGRQYDKNIDEDLAWFKYQKAKDKVLFENYTARKIEDYYLVLCPDGSNVWASWNKSKKVESLINERTNVTITPNAIKQLKL